MGQDSKIEWCHDTDNLWHGCSKVHAGCDNCYAEILSHRWGNDVWGNDKPRRLINSAFTDLDKYQNIAYKANEIRRVFVGSMMDIFEKPMPMINSKGATIILTTGDVRYILFENIDNGLYPNLLFLFLTKRPSNIPKYIPVHWKEAPPKNVMYGTSISDQETANTLVPQLMKVKGYKFLSVEPQIGPIHLTPLFEAHGCPDWIIQGGESGHKKRSFTLEWAKSMAKECEGWGIPYFFKQIDKVQQIPEDMLIRQFPILK